MIGQAESSVHLVIEPRAPPELPKESICVMKAAEYTPVTIRVSVRCCKTTYLPAQKTAMRFAALAGLNEGEKVATDAQDLDFMGEKAFCISLLRREKGDAESQLLSLRPG